MSSLSPVQLTEFNKNCVALLKDAKSRGRHSLRSAVPHLEKGWALADIDPAMAIFRAITAEEEAATAVMYALKDKGYPNAEVLNPWDHVQKNAVVPFIIVLSEFFGNIFGRDSKFTLHIREEEGHRRLMLGVPLPVLMRAEVDDERVRGTLAYPIPPLNFKVSIGGKAPSFAVELKKYLAERGATKIIDLFRRSANLRNEILYSAHDGVPHIESVSAKFFTERKLRVMAMLYAFLFIEPWNEQQPFVQDALNAFLKMLNKGLFDLHDAV